MGMHMHCMTKLNAFVALILHGLACKPYVYYGTDRQLYIVSFSFTKSLRMSHISLLCMFIFFLLSLADKTRYGTFQAELFLNKEKASAALSQAGGAHCATSHDVEFGRDPR